MGLIRVLGEIAETETNLFHINRKLLYSLPLTKCGAETEGARVERAVKVRVEVDHDLSPRGG